MAQQSKTETQDIAKNTQCDFFNSTIFIKIQFNFITGKEIVSIASHKKKQCFWMESWKKSIEIGLKSGVKQTIFLLFFLCGCAIRDT